MIDILGPTLGYHCSALTFKSSHQNKRVGPIVVAEPLKAAHAILVVYGHRQDILELTERTSHLHQRSLLREQVQSFETRVCVVGIEDIDEVQEDGLGRVLLCRIVEDPLQPRHREDIGQREAEPLPTICLTLSLDAVKKPIHRGRVELGVVDQHTALDHVVTMLPRDVVARALPWLTSTADDVVRGLLRCLLTPRL